jgi:hypothetical protein
MSKRLILGLLFAVAALALAACEAEEEGEEPEPTLAAQTPAAATAQATPTLPAEASPTPQATSTAAPTDLDWEKAEQSAIADNAKPRFRGEIGDFAIVEPNTVSGYPCPEPYGPAINLETSELNFNLPGAVIDSIGTGSCQGTVVSITAGVPDEWGGTLVGRGYFLSLPLEEAFDAPAERLELMTVAGKPALAVLPIPDCISCLTEVVVIERFPSEEAPGITAWVHTYSGIERAIALVEQIMAGGKQ